MPSPVADGALQDYWQVLGLGPGADPASLKQAFREQARRWHPDLNANDPLAEERFKRINEAYAVLSDPRRRRAWEAGESGPGGSGANGDPFASGFPEFEDYLAELFGRSRRHEQGAEQQWQEPGAEPEPRPEPQRGGSVTPTPAPMPPVQASQNLETTVELSPAQALEGERLELELPDGSAVEVWTPPLAGDGWRLHLAGVAPGGRDHFLQLRVRTPEGLRIDGLRVLYQLELSPAEAALGCSAVVPTLDGPVKLRVPAGSSSGRLLRLRGRGQILGEERGDQLVELRIVVPEDLSDAEQALYRRLMELEAEQ
ncbi:MAG: DnaJ domain-containing protein [Prochlorococcaceae cyanobacterium]